MLEAVTLGTSVVKPVVLHLWAFFYNKGVYVSYMEKHLEVMKVLAGYTGLPYVTYLRSIALANPSSVYQEFAAMLFPLEMALERFRGRESAVPSGLGWG